MLPEDMDNTDTWERRYCRMVRKCECVVCQFCVLCVSAWRG